jgi:hypothetical protein
MDRTTSPNDVRSPAAVLIDDTADAGAADVGHEVHVVREVGAAAEIGQHRSPTLVDREERPSRCWAGQVAEILDRRLS